MGVRIGAARPSAGHHSAGSPLREADLIELLTAGLLPRPDGVVRGVGDDCAVLEAGSDRVWLVTVDQQNFQTAVLQSTEPVLIDFWASWCGPCRMVAPVLDELADELDGKVKIAKVNVDENQDLAMQFRISSIPAFVLFKNGQVVERAAGAMPKAMFKNLLAQHI